MVAKAGDDLRMDS